MEPCKACGMQEFVFLFRGKDRFYHLPGEFDLYRCRNCGLILIHPQLSGRELGGYYPENYYSYQSSKQAPPAGDFYGKLQYYLRHPFKALNCVLYSKILKQNWDLPVRTGMRLLDVGCGDGWYLLAKRAQGCVCYGNDISRPALSRLKEAAPDIEVAYGALWDAGYPDGFFDQINLSQVIEHVTDIKRLLCEIRRIIKQDGWIRIQVPNAAGLTPRIFGQFWMHFDVPRHVYTFAPKNLKLLFAKSGLEIVSWRTSENSYSVIGSSFYFFNELFGRKLQLMCHAHIWDNEILKLLCFPYAFFVNIFRLGDNLEFVLKKKV